jgi:universal stress protein A
MQSYTRVLVAIDLKDSSLHVALRGQNLARASGAELHLLHVVEYIPVDPMGDNMLPPTQLIDELVGAARLRLTGIAAQLGESPSICSVEIDGVKAGIIRTAREKHCDLIVLGAHERHGLSIFVNFTEDAVLHAAPCDVLAVRVGAGEAGKR